MSSSRSSASPRGAPRATNQFLLATGGYDTSVRFFDAQNQHLVRTLQFCDQHVLRLAFSGLGAVPLNEPLYIVVAGSPTVCVYDISTSETPPNFFAPFKGHTEAVTAVGFEPNHTAFVFSASEDGTLQTWLPEPALAPHSYMHAGMPPPYQNHAMGNGMYPQSAALNRGRGRHPLSSSRPFTPTKFQNFGPEGLVAIHDATYYPPGDLFFTVDAEGKLRIWDHRTGQRRREVVPHRSKRNIQCLDLSSDYKTLVLANFDGIVFVYDVKKLINDSDPVVPISFRANSSYVTRVKLSTPGNLLACTTKQGAVKVFRMIDITASADREGAIEDSSEETVTPVWDFGHFGSHPGWVWDAAFVGDYEDYLFTCSTNMKVMLWTLRNVGDSLEYEGHQKSVVCLAVKERCPAIIPDQFGMGSSREEAPRVPHGQNDHATADFMEYGGYMGHVANGTSSQGEHGGTTSGTA